MLYNYKTPEQSADNLCVGALRVLRLFTGSIRPAIGRLHSSLCCLNAKNDTRVPNSSGPGHMDDGVGNCSSLAKERL
jgi:hypothetical protein